MKKDAFSHPTLDVYVSAHCWQCPEARKLAREAQNEFGTLAVNVIDLDQPNTRKPEFIFAVPTFVIDGQGDFAGHANARNLIPHDSSSTGKENNGKMNDNKIIYLRSNQVFGELCDTEMQELDRMTAMITCDRGRIFYTPGETGEVLFLLKHGRVQLYRLSAHGKKLVLATLELGTLFGEMALVGQGMYNTFAEAVEPCTLCAMSHRDVEMLITKFPRVGIRIIETLGHRLVDAEARLETIALKSVPARLASWLLRLARDNFVDGETHQTLAEMIGTYRETVTLALNDFKSQGLIDIQRKQIEIRDAPRLAQVAEMSSR